MSKAVFDGLGDVAGYALSVDDSILGDYELTTPNGVAHVLGLRRNGRQYEVRASPGKRYFGVDYLFRLSAEFEGYLQSEPDDVDSILEANDVVPEENTPQNRVQAAARTHVDSIPDEDVQAVMAHVTEQMTQVNCHHDWLWTGEDGQIWDGVRVTHRIYPYEADFSIREFDRAVTEVIGIGYSVTATVSEQLDLSIDIEDDGPTASGRGFQ